MKTATITSIAEAERLHAEGGITDATLDRIRAMVEALPVTPVRMELPRQYFAGDVLNPDRSIWFYQGIGGIIMPDARRFITMPTIGVASTMYRRRRESPRQLRRALRRQEALRMRQLVRRNRKP